MRKIKKFYVYLYHGYQFATIIGPYDSQDSANYHAERYIERGFK